MGSRILALQQTTSPSSSFSSAIDHVHHPAPQVTRCCLCCPQLLSLVHLPRPRIGDDLRGGRREQTFRLRLCHRPSCRTHGNQLRIQQEDPTSQCTLFRTQPEIIIGIWTVCTGLLPTHCSSGGPEKPPCLLF